MSDFTMENFFPLVIGFDDSNEGFFLEELCEDLKGILNKIIYVDEGEDIKYIKSSQNYLKKIYGGLIKFANSEIGQQIKWAYESFQYIFIDNSTSEFIVQQCDDILQEFLIYRRDDSFDYFKEFAEKES